jgi:hypothetical protein
MTAHTLADVANAIVALAGLAALLCLFYGPWQAVCTNLSRQIIFERRDRLFDMALAGRLDFDSEAYRATRRRLNGLLRFAHTLTWQELVVAAYFNQKVKSKIPDWRADLASLPPDVRKDVEELVRECAATLIGMMALKSLLIGPVVFVVAIGIVCTKGRSWLLHKVASQTSLDPLNDTIQTTSAEFAESEEVACAA